MSPLVYDDEKQDTGFQPDGSHDDLDMDDEQRQAEIDSLEDSFNSPSSDKDNLDEDERNPNQDDASDAEKKESDQIGDGYNENDSKKQKRKGVFNNKKGLFIGGGLGLGITGGILSISTLIMPLKIMHIANNLQERSFSASEKVTDSITQALTRGYITHKVIPNMFRDGTCKSTRVSKSCVKLSNKDGPISRLYDLWSQNNLEGKLASKYGMEITREGDKFYFRKGNQTLFSGVYDGHGDNKIFNDKLSSRMSKNDIRKELKKALEEETFYKRMMYRYRVGGLLERKYGIKRCLVACETRDKRNEKREDRLKARKLKWKLYLIDRVIAPRSEMIAFAAGCAISGFDCTKTEVDNEGKRMSKMETEFKEKLALSNRGSPDLVKISEFAESINTKGIGGTIISKLLGESVGKLTTKAIPYIGWIDLAVQVGAAGREVGPALKKMNYVVNSASMVTMYMMYRSNADEIKSGEADAEDIGIVATSLSPNQGLDQGGASAEQTPIYREIMGSQPSGSTALLENIFPKTYAYNGYACNDGTNIFSGVCPEVILTAIDLLKNIANVTEFVANSPLMKGGDVAIAAWNHSMGWVLNKASGAIAWVLQHIPGYAFLTSFAGALAAPLIKWFTSKLVKDMFGESPSGGRMFEVAAGGADVAGNDFAHYGLGGQAISAKEVAINRAYVKQQKLDDFNNSTLFAKVFSTDSDMSLLSRFAVSVPLNNTTGTLQNISSTLLNPGRILSSISLTNNKAGAQPLSDPLGVEEFVNQFIDRGSAVSSFGVTQYGYPSGSVDFNNGADLERVWEDNDCSNPDKAKQWGEKSINNPETGMPENYAPNICKALDSVAGANGAIYDDSMLGEDAPDAGDDSSSSSLSGAGVSDINVATYNIRADDLGGSIAKTKQAASLMKSEEVAVFGAQEVRKNQFNAIKESGFDGVVSKPDGRAIFWDSSKFTMKKSGQWMSSKDGKQKPMIWVELNTGSNQPFYLFNMHTQVGASNGGIRTGNAKDALAAINKVVKNNAPYVVTGDMNSNYLPNSNRKEVYSMFKDKLDLAFFKTSNKTGADCDTIPANRQECGRKPFGSHADQIYVSKAGDITVNSWKNIATAESLKISDHNPVIVNLTIPSLATTGEVAGWSWPLKNNINNGPCYGGSSVHAGMDMNSSTTDNPVYAMHSGKVARTGSGGAAGNYVTILADEQFNGKPVYYSFEHLKTGSLSVKTGDEVRGGQQIGIAGTTGNVSLGASKAHLHVVTATTNSLGSYGALGTTFDPMKILKSAGPAPGGYKCT